MKKFLYLTVIFTLSLLFTSCSRDSDSTPDNSWIYGRWNVTEMSDKKNGPYQNAVGLGLYAQFNENGTYNSKFDDYYNGTYTINGNTIKAKVYQETVVYNIIERNDNTATASMYYQSEPKYIYYFKLKKQIKK